MVALTPYWTKLRYHEDQNRLWNSKYPFCAVVAGRGSGKTELARRKIVLSLALKKEWPDPIYVYCLPTFAQAKRVAWKPILNLIPPRWIKKNGINIADMSIETIFGSTLYIMGMDKPQRIEGIQIDGAVIDECSDQKPGTFSTSILPTLSHRNPWCWRIGVPKRNGTGRIEFRAFYEAGIRGDENIDSYMWKSSTVLDPKELETRKSLMTVEEFEEQFNAVWLDAGGSIYHAFSDENLNPGAVYDPSVPIWVGADFNVDPMCWVLGHFEEGKLRIFDELFVKNTHTEACLKKLKEKYPEQKIWYFCGDASARYRKTATPKTDYLLIKNSTLFEEKSVFYPKKNPNIRDRFSTVNTSLCDALGVRKLTIHPNCKYLINDMRMMAYKEGTTDPEDYTGTEIGHMSDGLGYLVWKVLPMKILDRPAPVVIAR